ncbi:MAG: hypothetical protein EBQ92_01895 [Proteobacteria bacterium]|jgi:hypothetical protein|nr:hypothetical protein [Pseudomonadota bacterium]
MWLISFFVFSQLSLAALVPPTIEQSPITSASEILSWVKGPKPEVKTVEELLEKLPEAYRTFFVLQYDSHSNHSSNATHPRVIFFGPDAKLLLAFSGLPSDSFYETAEMIEYEPTTASYSFYSIHFQTQEPAQVEINPQDCYRCHGADPKPNWEPYSLWPGAFGSLHDRILPGTREHFSFGEFLKTYRESPRYRFLPQPFHLETQDSFGSKSYYLWNGGVGPGSSLSILLGFLNRDRIAKKLVGSEGHSRYRPALTAALIGCKESIREFLPDDLKANHPESFTDVLAETQTYMEKDFARKKRALINYLEVDEAFILENADLYGFRQAEIERIAKLRYLLTKRRDSIDFDRWASSISKTSLDFNDGVSGLENLIGHYLMLAYPEDDPIRRVIPLREYAFSPTSFTISTYSLMESPDSACELLLKEAKALSLVQ